MECKRYERIKRTNHVLFDECLDQIIVDLPESKFIVEDLRLDLRWSR